MAHFNLEKELNDVLRLDTQITQGPVPRWQRKIADSSKSVGQNLGNKTSNQISSSKTPKKGNPIKSGSTSKSPGKSPKTPKDKPKNPTPGRKTPKTPNGTTGDRFIPNRSTTQFEIGYFKLSQQCDKENADKLSPSKKEYKRAMSENLNGGDVNNLRIIHYANRAPLAPEGYLNNLRIVYSQSKTPGTSKKSTRHIPQKPERILDAPDIVDDFYVNLLDWSVNNHLAVALGGTVYLWNGSSGEIQQLLSMENSADYVSSVAWINEGSHLGIGNSLGEVQLWDIQQLKRVRNMVGHTARVGALSWNSYILTSGCRSSLIHHHDVRVSQHRVGTLTSHTQEVCGVRWSPDGRYLATGGNDNMLYIWSAAMNGHRYSETTPTFSFNQHQAAVKALAWCPWQSSLLASGGGTADRSIRFWNINTGICLNTVDTNSQVCSILWSAEHKEFISGHGFANNQLIIWKYPSLQKVTELTGHTARVLHLALSPDGTTVVSAAADETLRLWHCFATDPQKKKVATKAVKETKSVLKQSIR